MWKRITANKLCNLENADYIVINELSDDYGEVILGYHNREFAITDMMSYEDCQKYIDTLQKEMGGLILEQ